MTEIKTFIRRSPVLGPIARAGARLVRRMRVVLRGPFPGSQAYWERRYAGGHNSGCGSYGEFAEFKAEVLNDFVEKHGVRTVVEFGCGDGNQLSFARYKRYFGLDVSKTAIELCQKRFADDGTKSFHLYGCSDQAGAHRSMRAELALSLDVIYHLVEDEVYEQYMRDLFGAALRFVIIYSSNVDQNPPGPPTHVRNRCFTDWVEANCPDWVLVERIPNRYPFRGYPGSGSPSDFFIYERAPRPN